MSIATFKLEEYLCKYEFSVKHLLCCSDTESFALAELLAMADPAEQQLWADLRLNYTQASGLPELRKVVAESLYSGLSADNILMFAGAEDGIYCGIKALIEPNDHVIVLTPCYQSLLELPKQQGAKVTEILLKEANGWRINLNDIADAINPNTKCIVINFPHNPTGQIIEEAELKSLVDICKARDIWIFSDEVYRLLGKPDKPWAEPAACLYNKALSLGVMSKAFGMGGLRIGWVACQDKEILKKAENVKYYTSICNSAPSEIISLIALRNKDKILVRNNDIVTNNLRILDQFFAEYNPQFDWVKPQGGCVGFVKYNGNEPIDSFCERLANKKSVLLMPASVYNYEGNFFRIGFGRKNMPEALEKLREFIKVNR